MSEVFELSEGVGLLLDLIAHIGSLLLAVFLSASITCAFFFSISGSWLIASSGSLWCVCVFVRIYILVE